MDVYVLDACALIAAIEGEPGYSVVHSLFAQSAKGEISLKINKVNLLEVYYDAIRRHGTAEADRMLANMARSPVGVTAVFSNQALREAGRLKTSFKISIADSIALAEAAVHDGCLVTSDHHEFDAIEKNGQIKFFWIR